MSLIAENISGDGLDVIIISLHAIMDYALLSWITIRAYPQVCHGVNLIQNPSGRVRYRRGFILLLDETLVTELDGCIEGVVAPRYQVIIRLVVRSRLGS